ncbi:MAG TPA: ATPase, T2SS/T4P/T4SS family [Jiangellaceae bacterium]|nr:ATPase, T2SS/T4P/T4SS family [Jiangellaceae bacterium]
MSEEAVDGVRSMTALEIIDAEVRDVVRREGLDPVADPAAVRRIVDDVVATYDERSLSRPLPPLGDARTVARTVLDSVAGFGPLQRYLDDPTVEEIWINEPGKVFIARRGRSELTTTIFTDQEVRDLVERMLKTSGRRIDLSSPFVDAMLPDGSRLHVVIPDITPEHWAVNVRKFVVRATNLDDLVGLGTLTQQAARFLDACVVAGLNILVSGGTQAGKTTLLNCLTAAVPARERVITCEEVFELRIPLPDVVRMQTRQASLEGTGEISLRHLVREALRMRPQRIVVGEVRQQECLDLLIALNSGIPGMCTVHANSEAVTKMCTLPLLAGENSGGLSVFRTATTTGVARSPMALRRRSCGFTVVNIGVQPVSQPCLHGARRADSRGSTDAEPRLQPGRPVGPHLAPRLIDYPVAQPRSRGRGRAP